MKFLFAILLLALYCVPAEAAVFARRSGCSSASSCAGATKGKCGPVRHILKRC